MNTAQAYINSRLIDALTLLRIIKAMNPRVTRDGGAWFDLYTLNVLMLQEEDGVLCVSWYDSRAPHRLYECEGLTPFLAFVLRRWW